MDEEKKVDDVLSGDETVAVPEEVKTQNSTDEYLAGWKRALADYENLKRETQKDKGMWTGIVTADVITSFLPIYDYLQATVAKPPEIAGVEKWFAGVQLILTQFLGTLGQYGVGEIEVVGKVMDANTCEAVGTEKDETKEDNVVLRCVQTGFSMNGKVIRVAKVIVNQRS